MARLLAIAALFGLVLAPAAHAQISCAEMSGVMREAGNDFDDIAGAEIEDGVYEASLEIGGARECYVDVLVWASYYCLFQHEHPDTAFSAYGYRLSELRNCLSDWKQVAIPEDSPIDDGYRNLEGVRFTASDDNDGFEWLVVVEQHIVDGEAHYHVRVELSYF